MNPTEPEFIGYQAKVTWMGESVLTLADVWPDRAQAAIVGLNPAPRSVETGHYYQGRVGQRQLRRLALAGLFESGPHETQFEEAARAAGVGFTDLVKRPTPSEAGVTREELEFGRLQLADELEKREVQLIICVFRHPVVSLLGRSDQSGLQPTRTSWGAEVFRMPGPFAARAEAAAVMETLPRLR